MSDAQLAGTMPLTLRPCTGRHLAGFESRHTLRSATMVYKVITIATPAQPLDHRLTLGTQIVDRLPGKWTIQVFVRQESRIRSALEPEEMRFLRCIAVAASHQGLSLEREHNEVEFAVVFVLAIRVSVASVDVMRRRGVHVLCGFSRRSALTKSRLQAAARFDYFFSATVTSAEASSSAMTS